MERKESWLKRLWKRICAFFKRRVEKVKARVKKYQDDIHYAYNQGYRSGWENVNHIPRRLGAKYTATVGYRRGLRNRLKADKYIKRYQKGEEK